MFTRGKTILSRVSATRADDASSFNHHDEHRPCSSLLTSSTGADVHRKKKQVQEEKMSDGGAKVKPSCTLKHCQAHMVLLQSKPCSETFNLLYASMIIISWPNTVKGMLLSASVSASVMPRQVRRPYHSRCATQYDARSS